MPKTGKIKLKRVYDKSSDNDDYRILVDGIWPRGISKKDLKVNDWLKDIAPSTELRKWFAHDPDKWDKFKELYFEELKDKKEAIDKICTCMNNHTVTFVYAAKDRKFNNAVALKEYIESYRK